ncbi:MAG: hypothetical protein ACPG32_09385 [Akkermansiaceae bacterium]
MATFSVLKLLPASAFPVRVRRMLVIAGSLLASSTLVHGQAAESYNLPPMNYSKAKENNTISRLQAAIEEQKRSLPGSNATEILKALLAELKVPISSQTLVFSQTSLQRELIRPENPRAVYFNEDFYIGYVPGGLIEIIACDDPSGMMFYQYNPNVSKEKRKFVRGQDCMRCHVNGETRDIPGLMIRSVYAREDGLPVLSWGSSFITTASPIPDRWGGWYVTGTHGEMGHLGNKWIKKGSRFQKSHGLNVTDLKPYFNTEKYLTDTSDILALMLLEHQAEAHNIFYSARTGYLRAEFLSKAVNDGKVNAESLKGLRRNYVSSILKLLLFADEAKLPTDGIDGSQQFVKDFTAAGKSHDDYSLRDLRLQKRLFKYRCSYMIYSKSFALVPDTIRADVLKSIRAITTEGKTYPGLPSLSKREKERIDLILKSTLPEYAALK